MTVNLSRARDVARVLRRDGVRGLSQRLARVAYARTGAAALEFPLLPGDVADSTTLELPQPVVNPPRGSRLHIGWVTTPPGAGSGGHTTIFRMVQSLEAAGHSCTLFLYDRYGGDLRRHEAVVREGWPEVRAEVRTVDREFPAVDALVATSWQTAHVIAVRGRAPMRRLYFVQDFEPFFYPRGSRYALAEDTYRFGFRTVAVGHMVARLLQESAGVRSAIAEFGCDTAVYGWRPTSRRSGVVFYSKPGNDRRGFELGCLALKEFQRRQPGVDIHLVGDTGVALPFTAIRHGSLRPADLAALYNRCAGGLALSFTNISLVAEEMLACGAIPVVNDSEYARVDLRNEHVRWAAPTPAALADALEAVVRQERLDEHAHAASLSVRRGWGPAQQTVVTVVEDAVYGPAWTPRASGLRIS